MNENNAMKTMAFQELFVTLQNPRKDDGETLCCCRRNGRGIEPRPFLPKKGLRLTLSVVCLAELKGSCYCLSNIGTLVWDWGVLYTTQVVLPSTLTGDYEIVVIRGETYYGGYIEL